MVVLSASSMTEEQSLDNLNAEFRLITGTAVDVEESRCVFRHEPCIGTRFYKDETD